MQHDRLRDRDAERLGGFHVDREFETGWLFDRQVANDTKINSALPSPRRARAPGASAKALAQCA
ncbi:MAG: hypothetical protein A3G24_07240 [Betaproteobacteria bacterium RIFCSPLOWO2_12_FULL_62_13]|nr:MAG: hypothetical protein A3G24_07240 [Betaproteobacteria bacterium RIFCSPLOWO2_12_FULL_62_13]